MIVNRDFFNTLKTKPVLESVLLWGPRQVGKTTLLNQLHLASTIYLDDYSSRQKAQNDPALFFENLPLPCLIDEAQYAPNLFPEIKLRIDQLRRERLKSVKKSTTKPLFYLNGSNKWMLDKNVKESLAGRCSIFALLGFSVREILTNFPTLSIKTLLWRGGFPELYTRPELAPQTYLNDYISSFIEKDIAQSAGVEKTTEFHTVLGLLAARTGQFLNVSEVAGVAGVNSKTVQFWIDVLQKNLILDLVPPFHSNLSKRITKMKKLYFLDVGLCARLQGHNEETMLWNSPQAGALFETLVFSEIIKTKNNFLKDWQLFTWRTKERNEIDFVLQKGKSFIFLEAKMAIHGAKPFSLDAEALKVFKSEHKKAVITVGGKLDQLDRGTMNVPICDLGNFLLDHFN